MKIESVDHVNRIAQRVLVPTLLVSGLLSVWIVGSDGWLRTAAPSHEYGLLAFAVLDLLFVSLVFVAPRLADLGTLLIALIQASAMLGDAFTFVPDGTMQSAFRAYLLTDAGFVGLFATQLVLVGISAISIVLAHVSVRGVHGARLHEIRLT